MAFSAHSSGGWEVWNQGASTVNACFQDGRHQIPAVSSQMEGQQESWKGWGRPPMVLILSWGPHPGGLEGMVRMHHPKACSLGILNVLSWRHLKSSKCRHRLSLNPFDLSKNQASSERNTIVIDLLPGSFINQGELTFHRGGDQKLHHTKTDWQTIIPPSVLPGPRSSPLKITCSPLGGFHPSPPSPIKVIDKLSNHTALFFSCDAWHTQY